MVRETQLMHEITCLQSNTSGQHLEKIRYLVGYLVGYLVTRQT